MLFGQRFGLGTMEPQTPAPTTKPQPVTASPVVPPAVSTKPQAIKLPVTSRGPDDMTEEELKPYVKAYGRKVGKRGGRPNKPASASPMPAALATPAA